MAWSSAATGHPLARRGVRLGVILATRALEILSRSENTAGEMESGVYLSDRGHIIIGPRRIGAGTVVHDHVTIGRGEKPDDVPEIGRRVWIGPHCVIFGDIRVGDGVTVLPNTVLARSVPADAVVQGNPARIVRRGFDNSSLRRTRDPEAGAQLMGAGSA
jgi:serine acetyltransferase